MKPEQNSALSCSLSFRSRIRIALLITMLRIKEKMEFDSKYFNIIIGYLGLLIGRLFCIIGNTRRGFEILSKLHRSASINWICTVVENRIRTAVELYKQSRINSPLLQVFIHHIERTEPTPQTSAFFQDPGRPLRSLILVIKSPSMNEKGVIVIKYSHLLPIVAKLYNIETIATKYHLVLEPSWSGYCNLDILAYTRYRFPVFVQAYEPRDFQFIHSIQSNLIPVRVSANWWVDHRNFSPNSKIDKDIDIIMIASWAHFKRHHRFFSALKKLKQGGISPKVALLGYPVDRSIQQIRDMAIYYGVSSQLDIHECVPPNIVGDFLNRSKVNIIWSRKEGVNRAIIEGMFCNVPCILRQGFNYGYCYPYINSDTGMYSLEYDLPNNLKIMIDNYHMFTPRDWVMSHMSCQSATQILEDAIRTRAIIDSEHWTQNIAVKVNRLNSMYYFDESDSSRFNDDYLFLKAMIR